MTGFTAALSHLLELVEQDMRQNFEIRRDVLVEGRYVALEAAFDIEGERKPFGLISTGNMTHCHERCLFVPIEALTASGLEEALAYITQVHDHLVAPDASHEFSLFSLVLVTHDLPRALRAPLRKYAHSKRYETAGWSTVRVAAIDLSNGAIVSNKMGAALGDRLKPTVRRMK